VARAQLERLLQAWHGPASASQGSPPALVPSSWGVRTPLAGRPAQDPVHSPVGEGNVCGPGARRASQAALVWAAELAARAARTARATAATTAATPAVAAEVQDALEAATTACPSADRRTALGVHASGRRAGRVSLRSRRTRPAGRRLRATPSLVTSSLPDTRARGLASARLPPQKVVLPIFPHHSEIPGKSREAKKRLGRCISSQADSKAQCL